MIWSQFVHVIPGSNILWHAIRLEKIKVDNDVIGVFSQGGAFTDNALELDVYKELVSREFIVDGFAGSEKCPDGISEIMKERCNIQAMYLILTTKCNLRCSYCLYNSSGSRSLSGKGSHMRDETAIQAIDLFSEETSKNNRSGQNYWEEVTFYGGEPTLNHLCMETSISYIRELQGDGRMWKNIHFVLNTNGTMLSDNLLELLAKEKVETQVSIDGPRHIHDKVRMFKSGDGSFDAVVAGMKKMNRMGIDFVPLITISNANIEFLADCIEWLCREFSIRQYGLNLLMHTNEDVDPDYGEKAAIAMKHVHEVARSFGAVDKMYEGAFNAFSSGNMVSQSCGAGRKLVVFPDGGIHACQALEGSGITLMGQLPVFEPWSDNRVYWSRRNRFNNPTCLNCPAIGGCGGGCGASAYNATGSAHGIDPNHCGWMKAVFELWLKNNL